MSQVVARKVALKKAGREFKGLSPFKAEKSPSFFVNDQKGFYHCFASGEHGDIFKFVMETEGLSFPEAVERLAEEAGVAAPQRRPNAAEASRRTSARGCYELMEAAAVFFERAARRPGGRGGAPLSRQARPHAARRSQTFRMGYAPDGRSALKEHSAAAGSRSRDDRSPAC